MGSILNLISTWAPVATALGVREPPAGVLLPLQLFVAIRDDERPLVEPVHDVLRNLRRGHEGRAWCLRQSEREKFQGGVRPTSLRVRQQVAQGLAELAFGMRPMPLQANQSTSVYDP